MATDADPTLVRLLRQAEYADLSDADALAALAEPTIERRESGKFTIQGLTAAFPDRANGWYLAIKAAGDAPGSPYPSWAAAALVSPGYDLSDPKVRALLDGYVMGAVLSESDAADIKSLGIWHVDVYQSSGGTGTLDLAEIAAARAELALDALSARVTDRFNAVQGSILAGDLTTWDQARAALGAE